MRRLPLVLLAACLVVGAVGVAPAFAQTAQVINVDGFNDFLPANLVDNDSLDTEIKAWCTSDTIAPMDIGRVYMTNDNAFLYIGYYHRIYQAPNNCFNGTTPQLGIAIDVKKTPAGGTADPFTRKVAWNLVPFKPDFHIYFEPTGAYEELRQWSGTAWNVVQSGSGALGIQGKTSGFYEMKISLATLGVVAGDSINVEWWFTQNGPNKGPLDAVMSDAVQLSTPTGTTFDVTNAVEMTAMKRYGILSFVDNTPPRVTSATAVGFPLLADKSFGLTTNKIDVLFSEPVQQSSAQTPGNYVISGAGAPSVLIAQRDATNNSLVHLTLSTSTVAANANFWNVTVSNVQDLNGNVVAAPNNVGSFFVQNLKFEVDARVGLCKGIFATTDTFSVEGSLAPLTFTLCDNALMKDANADSIWDVTVPFSMVKNAGTGKAEASLEYKFARKCTDFEPLSGNRLFSASSDSGAAVTLRSFWNNDSPANFTDHLIDVVFKVDASMLSPAPAPTDTFWLHGSQAPLSFTTPSAIGGIRMRDDGVAPDAVAGDRIYTVRVTFPKCTAKNVDWKVAYRGNFECPDQGNRNVFLADQFGQGASELVLPARKLNRCTVTDKPITVIFKLDTRTAEPNPVAADTVAIGGDRLPLDFANPKATRMLDNGVAPDDAAGDYIYTRAVTFPDSTGFNVQFKYWLGYFGGTGGAFECFGFGNRGFNLDDLNHSTSNPMVRVLSVWDFCTEPASIPLPGLRPNVGPSFAILHQSVPNPFTPRTALRFDLKRTGHVTLSVYDITGRRVATLLDREMVVGPHEVIWRGVDDAGRQLKSGIYVYELAMGDERLSRRMVYTK